ncbi:MAG TPA: hypothetical protein VJU83_12525 [Burkholderiales bacterium]|nr:hypothetical protein [Burkholderiales bacterium]
MRTFITRECFEQMKSVALKPRTPVMSRGEEQQVVVTDARNRRIGLKKPGARALCRLLEVLGENGKNQMYFAIVAPLMFVREIDGRAIDLPDSRADLERLLDLLEEDGIKAVMHGLKNHFSHPALLRQQS